MNTRIVTISAISALVLAAIALALFLRLNKAITDERCLLELENCRTTCLFEFNETFGDILFDRSQAGLQLNSSRIDCLLQHPQGSERDECIRLANELFERKMTELDARERRARRTHAICRARCQARAEACQRNANLVVIPVDINIPVDYTDIDGDGKGDIVRVDRICWQISNPCEDCFRSLCPGSSWDVKAERDFILELVVFDRKLGKVEALGTFESKEGRAQLSADKVRELKLTETLGLKVTPTDGSEELDLTFKISN